MNNFTINKVSINNLYKYLIFLITSYKNFIEDIYINIHPYIDLFYKLIKKLYFITPIKIKKIIFILFTFFLIIHIFNKYVMPEYICGDSIEIPSFQGIPYDKAIEISELLRLKPYALKHSYDPKFPIGAVLFQKPTFGKEVKEGRKIIFYLNDDASKSFVIDSKYDFNNSKNYIKVKTILGLIDI